MKDSKYEYAKIYVDAFGFSIIPILLDSKKPAIEWKEFQQRKPTEEELKKWFLENNFNIGIVTGAISGIAVVDLDSKDAIEFARQNKFPKTPCVKTGKGYHLYFKYKNGVRNFQARDDLKDIDLRADGGYVLAPPSIHPQTKKPYEWITLPGEVDYAELPEIILQKPQQKKSQLAELYKGVPKGERNNTLTRLVGSWVSNGLSYEECLINAQLWNEKNNPPLPEKEVETTVKSIFEKHRKIDILPPLFEVAEIPFGYEMFNPQYKLYFIVKNVHQDKEAVKCLLRVRCENELSKAKDLYLSAFNFYSSRSATELAKKLEENLPNLTASTQLVESFKQEFLKVYLQHKSIGIEKTHPASSPEPLILPFIYKDTFNMIYGEGATGKSIFACYLANLLTAKGHKVLYLDYENPTPDPIARVIKKINPDAKNIYIRNSHCSFFDEVEQIYEEVKAYGISVIILDSVIRSLATDTFDPAKASLFFQYLSKIPVTWLLISHVAKNNPDANPFGSVFFFNLARNIWFAKRIQDHDSIVIQMVHKKSNFTKMFPSVLFQVVETEDGKFVIKQDNAENFVNKKKLILIALEEKPMTIQEISKKLPSLSYKLISKYLSQLQKEGLVKNEKGTWQIIENE